MGGPFPQSDFVLEVAPDSSGSPGTWVDYSVDAASYSQSGGERSTGEIATAGRDVPYVTAGKRSAVTYTIRVLYKTGVADLYQVLRAYFENKSLIWMRYTPFSETGIDDTGFQCGPGYLTACPPPNADASSGEALALEVQFLAEEDNMVTIVDGA